LAPAAALLLLSVLAGGPARGAESPARSYWPTAGWQVAAPLEAAIDPKLLQAFEAYAWPQRLDEKARAGVRTDGVVVIRGGVLIYERYGRGYSEAMPHLAWSASKSFVQALYGVAMQEGLLQSTATPSEKYLPAQSNLSGVTIQNLLDMSSGLAFAETYEDSPLSSSVSKMLYLAGHSDMAGFAAGVGRRAEPGRCWYYSSGDSNILMAALRPIVGVERYEQFPWTGLFDVIGMSSAVWESDGEGVFVGSSYVYATPRDLAKFGYLYLNDGWWEGRRVLPEGWAAAAATPNATYMQTCSNPPESQCPTSTCAIDPGYGSHWWTNRTVSVGGPELAWPAAPADAFAAMGHWGQRIFVIPSRDMVIVRTGDDRNGGLNDATFLALALPAFSAAEPSP
jgi:CubicO group peptidase (beta-lactamase class C family)